MKQPGVRVMKITNSVFPVVAMREARGGEAERPDYFGTAFAIAPGVFLTANHVLQAAASVGFPALAGEGDPGGPLGVVRVSRSEPFPDFDLAILHLPSLQVTLLNLWLGGQLQVLEDVSAFGFPHAITQYDGEEQFTTLFRAYKGYVITTRGFKERLPSGAGVYEVSTPFPEGLSGAPALWRSNDELVVVGVVLGESEVQYGGKTHRVGIALKAHDILKLRSEVLGKRIGDLVKVVAPVVQSG